MERIRMTEKTTNTICSIRVRRAASRFSFSFVFVGLFFDFLFAILSTCCMICKGGFERLLKFFNRHRFGHICIRAGVHGLFHHRIGGF